MPHRHHDQSPIPPIPPVGFDDSCGSRLNDLARLFGSGGHGWRGSWGPFHFDFNDGPGHRRGGRRHPGRKRMFESGELRLVLLKLIADEPRHGYDLIRAVEEMTGGEYAPSPGIVYPTLTMLEEMGLTQEQKSRDSKKVFAATVEGRSHLDENREQVDELIERLIDMRPPERSDSGPAISRAVKNLMTALSHRVGRDGLDDELLHDIAAILDEAAQRIERAK
jgi:DNA-binding PadR family transcriptional regulator